MRGGGGNDTFHVSGGRDTVGSAPNDSDRFYFDITAPVDATINGFNGEGSFDGDRLYFDNSWAPSITYTKNEVGGKTEFELEASGYSGVTTVTVDKVGLEEGVDFWFI
jgi:hypothetical protein